LRDHAKGGRESVVTRDELVAILKGRPGDFAEQSVVISADRNVRYEEVINVMDVLQQQQIRKVGLLTQAKGR
jgi:biopolymer transport protein TolR